jgi:hypothetical protein
VVVGQLVARGVTDRVEDHRGEDPVPAGIHGVHRIGVLGDLEDLAFGHPVGPRPLGQAVLAGAAQPTGEELLLQHAEGVPVHLAGERHPRVDQRVVDLGDVVDPHDPGLDQWRDVERGVVEHQFAGRADGLPRRCPVPFVGGVEHAGPLRGGDDDNLDLERQLCQACRLDVHRDPAGRSGQPDHLGRGLVTDRVGAPGRVGLGVLGVVGDLLGDRHAPSPPRSACS